MRYFLLWILTLSLVGLSAEKDPVLENLQLTNQGISSGDTFHNSSSENPNSSPSDTPISSKNQISSESQKTFQKDVEKSDSTEKQIQTLQQLAEKFPEEYKYPLHKLKIEIQQNFINKASRNKYKKYFKIYEKLIQKYPQESEVYWEFFNFIHNYVKWTLDTPIYDGKTSKEALNLLKEIDLKFKEQKKISTHLCFYLILHHFYTEGLQKCEQSIQQNPQEPLPYLFQFQHSQKSQKKDLLLILRKFPTNDEVLYFVGNYFKKQEKYPLSIQYLKKAHELNPQSINVLIDLADVLFKSEKYEEALSSYINACKINSIKTKPHFRKSKSLLSQKSLFSLANTYETHINTCQS